MSGTTPASLARQELLQLALRYPDAHEDHPWGETVVKVKGKVFVFVGENEGRLSMTTKLPRSGPAALTLPFTAPCGYGLGKSGWVTARFDAGEDIPTDLLVAWVDESYRAVAPKRSVKVLEGALPAAAPAPARKVTKKKAAKKAAKKVTKKTAKKTAKKAARRSEAATETIVLFVDDFRDERERELVVEILEDAGFRTEQASDGKEALEKSLTLRPEVILMDPPPGIDDSEITPRKKAAIKRKAATTKKATKKAATKKATQARARG